MVHHYHDRYDYAFDFMHLWCYYFTVIDLYWYAISICYC